jgi:hypothetical protein
MTDLLPTRQVPSRNIIITTTTLDISGQYVKTRFEWNSTLQSMNIKDPGVALTTLGVTEPKRRRFDV